ncbi:Nuclear speckle splicing regulatory protein 1 [Halotydeus destructor]|nr:Nuclear speckle splicing regulatory protein 1 [Halotydeus destructor]
MAQKQYGLILAKDHKKQQAVRASVFEESDEESDGEFRAPEKKVSVTSGKVRRQTQLDIAKALEEDPSVYEYDSVYDSLKPESSKKAKETKPKYMDKLLKAAEIRVKEQERRTEKKIQKEREEEGDEFADKDAFVTSAYKEKLKELKETEEKDMKEKACEDILDVRKQRDLSGFYRHLMKQSFGEEKLSETARNFDSVPAAMHEIQQGEQKFAKKDHKHNQKNLRARKDSSESEDETPLDSKVISNEAETEISSKSADKEKQDTESSIGKEISAAKDGAKETESKPEPETEKVDVKPKLSRMELVRLKFTKRTINEVFDAARERYLERKRLREG